MKLLGDAVSIVAVDSTYPRPNLPAGASTHDLSHLRYHHCWSLSNCLDSVTLCSLSQPTSRVLSTELLEFIRNIAKVAHQAHDHFRGLSRRIDTQGEASDNASLSSVARMK